jgi:hypothetical protein
MLPNAKRWVFACERCNEIALMTVEMALRLDDRESPGQTVCQPALCPKCSGALTESASHASTPLLEFYDPPTDQSNVVLIDPFTLRNAQKRIARCEYCFDEAEITFDYILDEVTGCDPNIQRRVAENSPRL